MAGTVLILLGIAVIAFFIIYRRGMPAKMFSLQAAVPAGELQQQLQKTADEVIKKLEMQIAHLEFLLDEADNKIAELDGKLQLVGKAAGSLPAETSSNFDCRLPPETPVDAVAMPVPAEQRDNEPKDCAGGDKRRMVIALAEQGYSVTEIAKTTGMGKGAIMLFMQLHKK